MANKQPTYLCLDIGGTKISAGLVSGTKVIGVLTEPTGAKKGRRHVVETIEKLVAKIGLKGVNGIGVAIAGAVNPQTGIIASSPNFAKDFRNVSLKTLLSKKFRKPVRIDNDANCFTLAEALLGAGKDKHRVIGFTVGTGIGGGIVVNGKVYHGRDGYAGHLGHHTIMQGGLVCSCGQRGHLEAYASGASIMKQWKAQTGKPLWPHEVYNLARQGNKHALAIYRTARAALAEGIANAINIFNPDVVVIGGGLTTRPQALATPAIKLCHSLVFHPALSDTPVRLAKLKYPGIVGAALLFTK